MAVRPFRLIIISRDALLSALDSSETTVFFRDLASLTRKGYRILLTAPEPDRWVPTRKNVDLALGAQQKLMERAREEGGDIEGVYYVPRSLLTQDRNRVGALNDILERYSTRAERTTLISSSSPFLKAAQRIGIQIREVKDGEGADLISAIMSLSN